MPVPVLSPRSRWGPRLIVRARDRSTSLSTSSSESAESFVEARACRRSAVPFIPSCPGPLARTPGGYLAVVAPCRDGLDVGSVLGHHLARAACGAHLRARVVNKNQTDRSLRAGARSPAQWVN